ncbi:MAG: glycosyltransferase [Bacteroidetes bacterium]|nr:glycosyltransferase [Bacteroidota bacterium]
MKIFEIILLVLYGGALFFIFCYSIIQLHLVYLYLRGRTDKPIDIIIADNDEQLPIVTVQLPIYNELYVVERLIDAVASFDYPKSKLEIQILDDSDDKTVELIANKVDQYKQQGIDIVHFRRPNRKGYKAGALHEGLEAAKGEFIAIFDADFIPRPEFLRRTVPYFKDETIGAVQTKWEHINRDYSLLTKLQAFGLDAHFSIEQKGRNLGKHFINFNGTAGIWRKACINDAGGWQPDTLTEDLDLSYRAQINGWKFKYMEEFGSPAELPAVMSALKTQQFRWTKGGAETARKNIRSLLRTKLPLVTKIHGVFHLLNSTVFVCVLIAAILSVPLLLLKQQSEQYFSIFQLASLFLISFLSLCIFYYVSLYQIQRGHFKTIYNFIKTFPVFLSVSMGLSLHNAIAVIEGYLGMKSAFIRTPKFNLVNMKDSWMGNKYHNSNINPITFLEGLLCIYFSYGIYLAFRLNDYSLLPFHIMLFAGYFIVFFYSIYHSGLLRIRRTGSWKLR